jgi:amidase
MGTWIIKREASGSGLRVAIKDLIDMAGLPTTAGSRAVADTAEPAARDAACLAGFRTAEARGDAVFAGKTSLHELAYGISGVNEAFGTPVNPLDPRRVPGGSSSGSATAVASGEADIAYGSDTGGSIRIPAACCGIAGLKTTWGRIPLSGVWPLAPSLDTVGPMARDVAGLAAGMALLEPGFTVTPADSAPRRIGRLRLPADPVIDEAVDRALAAAGFTVQTVTVERLDDIVAASMTLLDAEAWASNRELVTTAADRIGADTLRRLRGAEPVTAAGIAAARGEIARWEGVLSGFWERVDLLALPTLLGFPPLLEDAGSMFRIRGLTAPVNAAGLPALALPVPVAGPAGPEGPAGPGSLPASVQLIGPRGSENRLLASGAILEHAVRR